MPDYPQSNFLPAQGSGPAPANFLLVAWNHKLLMVLGLCLGLGAASWAYVVVPRLYQASAQVLVVNKRPDSGANDTRPFAFDDYVAPHQELLKSPLIIGEAIKKQQLQTLDSFQGETGDLVEAIHKVLAVSRTKGPEGKSNVLQLTLRSSVPEDGGTILRAILGSYKDFLSEKYKIISDDALELILRETKNLEKELAQKETAYQAFRAKGPLLSKGRDGLDLRQERLNSIQAKRSALLLRRLELQGQVAAIEAGLKEGRNRDALLAMAAEFANKGEADDPRREKTATLQDQLLPLLAEEHKLLAQYGPKHPDVKAAHERVKAARIVLLSPPVTWGKDSPAQAQDSLDLHIQILRQKLSLLQTSERLLAELFDTESNQAKEQAGFEIQDESYKTSITMTKQLYEGLTKKLRDVNVAAGAGGCEVEVIGAPAPGRKVFPSATLFGLGGVVLGCLAGLGLAYLAEFWGKRRITPEGIDQLLGLPVLATLPSFHLASNSARSAGNGSASDSMLCTVYQPMSREAETYRALRDALCLGSLREGYKVIQITSPRTQEGKSVLAANLAVSMAQANKSVLLIDADSRRSLAQSLFGLAARSGLISVLAGETEPFDAIQESGIAHLAVLPCGSPGTAPAQFLATPRFQELLAAFREKYDFVVVDTPGLETAKDVATLAASVDGVLLTLNANGPALNARRASETLAKVGARVLGVVLGRGASRFDPAANGYGAHNKTQAGGHRDASEPRPRMTGAEPSNQGLV